MVSITLLQIFIWSVVLVSLGQVYLIARYLLWPRICRVTHCPWCWQDAGIQGDFPAPWSSTICTYHSRQLLAQSRTRHLSRQMPAAPATKPVAEEVQIWV